MLKSTRGDNMQIIDVTGMPVLVAAHTFQADNYNSKTSLWNNRIEISYIVEGKLEFVIDSKVYVAEKGDISVGLKDKVFTVRTDSFHRHHTMVFEVPWNLSDDEISGFMIPKITKASNETKEIEKLINDVIFSSHKYTNSPGRCAATLFTILHKIDHINRKISTTKTPEYSLVAQSAKTYIQDRINLPITQKSVADYLGISPSQLCNTFKKAEGISLMRYINTLKLNNIRALMKTHNMKLYQAAELYGYTDANYVSLLHKKIFGYNITE